MIAESAFEWSGFVDIFNGVQQLLFENVVQPLAFAMGAGNFLAEAYDGTGWLLIGAIQILVMVTVFRYFEKRFPAEPVTDRAAVHVDVIYTLIHRLGLFKLLMFFTIDPLLDDGLGLLRVFGLITFHVDQLVSGWTDLPWMSFALYLVIFDFVQYVIHRGQHYFGWWWALHAVHHSQRQMTMWSDNRNHFLDDLIRDIAMVFVAILIGVPPGQFVILVALTQLSESFQHANVRLWFGTVFERLWVSPRFHRLHHSIGLGHESGGRDTLGGCNFGVLLPWWDVLFRTANFEYRFDATGIRDQAERQRDYGQGLWKQQWLGILRLMGRA